MYLCVELELDSLLGHDPLEGLADLGVDPHPADVAKELNGSHLGQSEF